jgi:hypothetical protein
VEMAEFHSFILVEVLERTVNQDALLLSDELGKNGIWIFPSL